jgi:hypothetical protein
MLEDARTRTQCLGLVGCRTKNNHLKLSWFGVKIRGSMIALPKIEIDPSDAAEANTVNLE